MRPNNTQGNKKKGKGKKKRNNGNKSGGPFEGQSKEASLKGVVITEGNKKATQYKKFKEAMIAYASEQNYPYVADEIRDLKPKPDAEFFKATKPDRNLYEATAKKNMGKKELPTWVDVIYMPNEYLWKEVNGKYQRRLEAEEEKLEEYKQHRKTIIELILCQLGPSLLGRVKRADDYKDALKDGDLSKMLRIIRGICIIDDNHNMTFKPVKALANQKLLQNSF